MLCCCAAGDVEVSASLKISSRTYLISNFSRIVDFSLEVTLVIKMRSSLIFDVGDPTQLVMPEEGGVGEEPLASSGVTNLGEADSSEVGCRVGPNASMVWAGVGCLETSDASGVGCLKEARAAGVDILEVKDVSGVGCRKEAGAADVDILEVTDGAGVVCIEETDWAGGPCMGESDVYSVTWLEGTGAGEVRLFGETETYTFCVDFGDTDGAIMGLSGEASLTVVFCFVKITKGGEGFLGEGDRSGEDCPEERGAFVGETGFAAAAGLFE